MEAVASSNSSVPSVMTEDIDVTVSQTDDVQEPVDERPPEGGSSGGGKGELATDASPHKINGDTKHSPVDAPVQPSVPTRLSEDTQTDDVEASKETEEAPSRATAPSAANGTPVTNKRTSTSASSKKKSSAVPEHKSKKLNKKKSKPLTNLGAQPGEYYFARMKGHPPWPSIICDEEMLPLSLLTTRPVTAALPDGSFKRADYAEGGKRAYERTFPVMFLHTNEFAWIPNTELAPLDVESDAIKNPSEKGKSKTLLAAYAKAAEASDLGAFKTMLAEHQKALQEDLALQEERAAKKEEKAKRAAARKNSAAAVEDDDEMDIEDEAAVEKSKSKKRKKATDDSDGEEKPSKTPKTATKLKLSTPKQPTESASKKKTSKSKSRTTKNSSDDEVQTPKVEEKPPSPAALREIKEKKVLYYRHKLQRGFLSRDTVPKAEEMKSMSDFLSELETFPDLEGSIIRTTKIHKVLKQMIKIEHIPLEEEFKFKDRSTRLLSKWNETLLSEGPSDEKTEEKEEEKGGNPKPEDLPSATGPAPTVNGGPKGNEEDASGADAGENGVVEPETQAKSEGKIATTAEGKKEAEAQKPAGREGQRADKRADENKSDVVAAAGRTAGEEHEAPTQEAMDTA